MTGRNVWNGNSAMFESWTEAVDAAAVPWKSRDAERESRRIGRDDFSGVSSWEEAATLATAGWPDGRERVSRFAATITDAVRGRMRRIAFESAEYGPIFDVGAFIEDDPYCFLRPFETDALSSGRGIVKIVASLGARADVTQAVYTMRGAAMVAIVDALESTGRRVDLIGTYSATSWRGSRMDVAVQLKRPDQMMSPAVMAFALAHPASLRRIGFAIRENAPKDIRDRVLGVGQTNGGACASATHPLAATADIAMGPAYTEPQWFDEKAATQHVVDILKRQGVAMTE